MYFLENKISLVLNLVPLSEYDCAVFVLCYGSINLLLPIWNLAFLSWLIMQRVKHAIFKWVLFSPFVLRGAVKAHEYSYVCIFWNVYNMCVVMCFCVLQFSPGVQLLGVVCVLHHPRPPEDGQPRPLHPGKTFPSLCFAIPRAYHKFTKHFQMEPQHLSYRSVSMYVSMHVCCTVWQAQTAV